MPDGKQSSWWMDPRQWLRTLMMLDDTPHRVALGAAIGMFLALTPTVGIQMILVMVTAVVTRPLFRFNKTAALVAVYVSNPLTVIPIYWFDYRIGAWFLGGTMTRDEFVEIFEEAAAGAWWASTKTLFVNVGTPLVLGALIFATIGGLLTYPFVRRLLRSRQRRLNEADGTEPTTASGGHEGSPDSASQSVASSASLLCHDSSFRTGLCFFRSSWG